MRNAAEEAVRRAAGVRQRRAGMGDPGEDGHTGQTTCDRSHPLSSRNNVACVPEAISQVHHGLPGLW
jgi:hypothetical protein